MRYRRILDGRARPFTAAGRYDRVPAAVHRGSGDLAHIGGVRA